MMRLVSWTQNAVGCDTTCKPRRNSGPAVVQIVENLFGSDLVAAHVDGGCVLITWRDMLTIDDVTQQTAAIKLLTRRRWIRWQWPGEHLPQCHLSVEIASYVTYFILPWANKQVCSVSVFGQCSNCFIISAHLVCLLVWHGIVQLTQYSSTFRLVCSCSICYKATSK